MIRLGWFSSGRDREAQDLLEGVYKNKISRDHKIEISFVFSNREFGQSNQSDDFLHLVKGNGIPLITVSSHQFEPTLRKEDISEWRLAYDRKVVRSLKGLGCDLCVLAGYMLITSPLLCTEYTMINLHPALPWGPPGTWQEVIWELIETNASESGAMMHLVTPDLDKGPPVTYCKYPIRGPAFDEEWKELENTSIATLKREKGECNSLFKTIRHHGFVRELPLLLTTIEAFSVGTIRICKGLVLDSQNQPIQGYDLTEKINPIIETGRS
ncbi:MAG: formyltransferase family protein [Chloroflexota bacterium]|nr:formyltransferase family protein [Chloroflexota bacterium]